MNKSELHSPTRLEHALNLRNRRLKLIEVVEGHEPDNNVNRVVGDRQV